MAKKILSAPAFIVGLLLVLAQFMGKYFVELIYIDIYYKKGPIFFVNIMEFFDFYILLWIGALLMIVSAIFTVKNNKSSKINKLSKENEEQNIVEKNTDLNAQSGELDLNKVRQERNIGKEALSKSVDLSSESGEVDLNKLRENQFINESDAKNETQKNKNKSDKKFKALMVGLVIIVFACGMFMNSYYKNSISYYQKHGVPIEDGKIQIDKDDFIAIINHNITMIDNKWGDYEIPNLEGFTVEDASTAGEGYHFYHCTVKMDKEPDINIVFLLDEENKIEYINIGYNWIEVKPKNEDDIANQLYDRDSMMAAYCNIIYGSLSGFYNQDVEYYNNIMGELYDLEYDKNFVAENEYKGDNAVITWSYTEERQSMIEIDKLVQNMY